MAWEEVAAKLLPKEWLVPALSAAVGTGVISILSAYWTWLVRLLTKVGPSPWPWWFVFSVLMLAALSIRHALRKSEVKRRADQRVKARQDAAASAEKAAADRRAREHCERAAYYLSLRPVDRAVLAEYVETGVRTMTPEQIHSRLRSKGVADAEIGPALQRLHDRNIIYVGRPDFMNTEANLLDPHFERLNADPSLLAEPATAAISKE